LATDERENNIILLKPCYMYWPHARIYGLACGPYFSPLNMATLSQFSKRESFVQIAAPFVSATKNVERGAFPLSPFEKCNLGA
jgi:hypothetical protein